MSSNGEKKPESAAELLKQIEAEIDGLFSGVKTSATARTQTSDTAADAALKTAKRELVSQLYSAFVYATSSAIVAWTAKRVLRDVFGYQITFWQLMRVINAVMLAVRFIKTDGLKDASAVSGKEIAEKVFP